MEQLIFNFITQTLVLMDIAPEKINEESDILFDLDLDVSHLDSLFSQIENQFQLNGALMFNWEMTTIRGLANFVGHRALQQYSC